MVGIYLKNYKNLNHLFLSISLDGDDDENDDRYARISGSEESESDENDFIVDDNDQPISKPKKKKGDFL